MPAVRSSRKPALAEDQPVLNFLTSRWCIFDRVPIEILQLIGLELHQNDDLKHYAQICRSTFSALERDNKHFWRLRYLKSFDSPDWPAESSIRMTNTRFKRRYLKRQMILSGQTVIGFASGSRENEKEALRLLTTLMKEATFTAETTAGTVSSNNLAAAISFVRRLNCFHLFYFDQADSEAKNTDKNGQPRWNDLLLMIQCMFMPETLNKRTQRHKYAGASPKTVRTQRGSEVLGFPISQSIAYASAIARPLFGVGAVNFETILHHVNFWQYHFLYDQTGAITQWYADLDVHERPSFWTTKLARNDLSIEHRWKGTYAYLDDRNYFCYDPDGTAVNGQWKEKILQDEFLGEGVNCPFQELEFSLCDIDKHCWPQLFDYYLPRSPACIRPRTRSNGIQYQDIADLAEPLPLNGNGVDQGEHFFLSGWLEQMPDQYDIPGWRRMSMMKYYIADDTGVVDDDSLWAYEGVVFPGGRIIVGRWWHPTPSRNLRHAYRGPFILWAVNSGNQV